MTVYIYSTLTASNIYCFYEKNDPKENALVKKKITINGGANNAHKDVSGGIYTPRGVPTEISNEDFEILQTHPSFISHVENGFVTWEKSKSKSEKALNDLQPKDKSAPLTPDSSHFHEENGVRVFNEKKKVA